MRHMRLRDICSIRKMSHPIGHASNAAVTLSSSVRKRARRPKRATVLLAPLLAQLRLVLAVQVLCAAAAREMAAAGQRSGDAMPRRRRLLCLSLCVRAPRSPPPLLLSSSIVACLRRELSADAVRIRQLGAREHVHKLSSKGVAQPHYLPSLHRSTQPGPRIHVGNDLSIGEDA